MPLTSFSPFVVGNVFPPSLYIENKTNVIRYSTNILLIKLVLNLRVNLSILVPRDWSRNFDREGKEDSIVGEELERERNKEKEEE